MSLKSDSGSLGVELLHLLLCVLAELSRRQRGLTGSAGVRRMRQPQLQQPSAPRPGPTAARAQGRACVHGEQQQ